VSSLQRLRLLLLYVFLRACGDSSISGMLYLLYHSWLDTLLILGIPQASQTGRLFLSLGWRSHFAKLLRYLSPSCAFALANFCLAPAAVFDIHLTIILV